MNNNILKVCVYSLDLLAIAGITFVFAAVACFGAEIKGPESVQIGQLATFESDVEGDWLVVPAKGVGVAKDTGKKALYLAATCEGDYTLIFFAVENGQPVITQKSLTVGEVKPDPEPEPTPDSLESAIQQEAQALEKSAKPEEFQAMCKAFQAVIDGVAGGSVKTAADARATLRIVWQKEAAAVDGALDRWKAFLDCASEKMDIQTVDGMKADCEKVVTLLKSFGQEKAKDGSDCASGQCKPVQRGWRR